MENLGPPRNKNEVSELSYKEEDGITNQLH